MTNKPATTNEQTTQGNTPNTTAATSVVERVLEDFINHLQNQRVVDANTIERLRKELIDRKTHSPTALETALFTEDIE